MGQFIIRRSKGNIVVKLKGRFETKDILWISNVIEKRKFFHCKFFQIDIGEVETIKTEVLFPLFDTLQRLQKKEIKIEMIGLDFIKPNFSVKKEHTLLLNHQE